VKVPIPPLGTSTLFNAKVWKGTCGSDAGAGAASSNIAANVAMTVAGNETRLMSPPHDDIRSFESAPLILVVRLTNRLHSTAVFCTDEPFERLWEHGRHLSRQHIQQERKAAEGAGVAVPERAEDLITAVSRNVEEAGTRLSDSRHVSRVARAGMAARGVVYVLLGSLAVMVSTGNAEQDVDQRGAFTELASQRAGGVVLAAVAVGLAAYALWQALRAATGRDGASESKGKRLVAAGVAVSYTLLMASTVTILLGSRDSQSSGNEVLTARVMSYPGGSFLVAVVGLGVVGIGAVMVLQGVRTDFMRHLEKLPRRLEPIVRHLGRVGSIGRGAVFALVGALVVSAAVTFSPEQAGGVDEAFRTMLGQPYGSPVALVAALALVAFGLYCLAEARYRRLES
jgi:hypothetical protein